MYKERNNAKFIPTLGIYPLYGRSKACTIMIPNCSRLMHVLYYQGLHFTSREKCCTCTSMVGLFRLLDCAVKPVYCGHPVLSGFKVYMYVSRPPLHYRQHYYSVKLHVTIPSQNTYLPRPHTLTCTPHTHTHIAAPLEVRP